MSFKQELLLKIYFNDQTFSLQMTSADLENYEKLQLDYKRLLSEYNEMKKYENNDTIDEKLKEINNKHKEITVAFININP